MIIHKHDGYYESGKIHPIFICIVVKDELRHSCYVVLLDGFNKFSQEANFMLFKTCKIKFMVYSNPYMIKIII